MLPEALLCLLLALTPAAPQIDSGLQDPAVTGSPQARPYFSRCRSTNQETFTCWWSVEDDGNAWNASYTLTYSVGQNQLQECPDYTTGGDRSCFFDSQHTQVWEPYCLVVTAQSPSGSASSEEICLDVIDIVEPDPPFNLSWSIMIWDHSTSVLLTWSPPNSADVKSGWMSLVYQLNYRPAAQQGDWKVRGPLTETQLQLFSLTPGESYLFQVRCKPNKSGRWSDWSKVVELQVPGTITQDGDLLMLLILLLPVTAFLFIGLSYLLLGQRFKRFLLPPIPIPRISGIDSSLLKKGRFAEIDRILMMPPPQYMKTQLSEDFTSDVILDGWVAAHSSPEIKTINRIDCLSSRSPETHKPVNGCFSKGAELQEQYVSEMDRSTHLHFGAKCPDFTQNRVEDQTTDSAPVVAEDKYTGSRTDISAETSTSIQRLYMHVTDVGGHGTMKLQCCNLQEGYLLTPPSYQPDDEATNQQSLHQHIHSHNKEASAATRELPYADHLQVYGENSSSAVEIQTKFSSSTPAEPHSPGILEYISMEHMLLHPQVTPEVEIVDIKHTEEYMLTEAPSLLVDLGSDVKT